MKRALFLMLLVGCSANDPPSSDPDGGEAGAVDAGFDARSQCPAENPHSGSCNIPGVGCPYDFNDAGEPERCDCVAPENEWICCRAFLDRCPSSESQLPYNSIGKLCCPGDAPIFPFEGLTRGCSLCYPDDHQVEVDCSSPDRHWRRIESTCVNAHHDAGVDTADGASMIDDAGTTDAGVD